MPSINNLFLSIIMNTTSIVRDHSIAAFRLPFIISLASALALFSCKEDPPVTPPPAEIKPQIYLTIQDKSAHQIWIDVSLSDTVKENDIKIYSNDSLLANFSLSSKDTALYFEALNFNTEYNFIGYLYKGNILLDTSNKESINTLDTTSSNYTWETIYLDCDWSSFFEDVSIISENEIWVVGHIYGLDSLGNPDPIIYGAAYWDGSNWELKRIAYKDPAPNAIPHPGPIYSILALSSNEIYVTSGHNLLKWNGINWEEKALKDLAYSGAIREIWGTGENNIYGAGYHGAIYHYSGNGWTQMTTPTNIDLSDIWGTSDGSRVWACGYDFNLTKSILLEYDGSEWRTIWERVGTPATGLKYASTVWAYNQILYVAGGRSAFHKHLNGYGLFPEFTFQNWPYRMRGINYNDIFLTGDDAMMWHFNGIAWHLLYDANDLSTNYDLDVKENIIVAVGYESKPRIMIGKR